MPGPVQRILYAYRGDPAARRPSIVDALEAAGFAVDCLAIPFASARSTVAQALRRRVAWARYDLVVAGDYLLAWAFAVRLAGRRRPRLAAAGFNQSSRLVRTGLFPLDRLLDRVWRRVAAFVVHSEAEADLFARAHAIPRDRFVFLHWGYDLPPFEREAAERPPEPYVSMIGRNNRDLATFCAAAPLAGVAGVVVTSAETRASFAGAVPPGVRLLVDRPMEECLDLVAGSLAHLVLVRDGARGAGHISAVSAMLLGKPQVFSRVDTLADYLVDGVNGLAVAVADAAGTGAALRRLADDPALAARLGDKGRRFAEGWLSDRATMARTVAVFRAVADGAPLPRFEDWRSLVR